MSKAGRIILLVALFLAVIGATHETGAKAKVRHLPNHASTCSSSLVSTQLCNDLAHSACQGAAIEPLQRQVAGSVVIAAPNTNSVGQEGTNVETTEQPAPLPPMPVLQDQYASASAVLNSERIFELVNQYRASLGLAAFEKDESVCSLAATRSNEIIAEIGGSAGYLHSGLYNRGLPYWIWENAKYGSNEEGTVAWWLASPVHHQSIVGNFKFSCVKCTGSYCAQLFTSFEPK